MRDDIFLSISDIQKWEYRCLIKLCETTTENNLTYRDLLSVQLSAGMITKKEYDFCLFGQKLGDLILAGEIETPKLKAAYRNYLSVSLEVSRIYARLKMQKKRITRVATYLSSPYSHQV